MFRARTSGEKCYANNHNYFAQGKGVVKKHLTRNITWSKQITLTPYSEPLKFNKLLCNMTMWIIDYEQTSTVTMPHFAVMFEFQKWIRTMSSFTIDFRETSMVAVVMF
ncbi:hypothetical protein DPMN_078849 [Dreissena polymorpha]|uniref:Uncharacterized protein n=1 Tax=Dreissena polymorpha TaxID=45954 RepID=A0A9D4BSH5_DREPO|nr:hypothetical protein DPMN_078849 [Dreissena polymorpha]